MASRRLDDQDLSRRAVLRGLARVAAAGALVGLAGLPPVLAAEGRAGRLYRWQGVALGGLARLWIAARDRAEAQALTALALAEKDRLERIFSLYRPDSALTRLNREGRLPAPPAEMLELLSLARRIWEASGGAFDPTVQPLYAAFAAAPNDPDPRARRRARALLGFDAVAFDATEIALAREGMALTFNGIAQGYITDRVADLLVTAGARAALVEFGELRAFGRAPGGAGWPVRVGDGRLALGGAQPPAMAVSDTMGTRIAGHYGHVFDPRRGRPVKLRRRLAVEAQTAALADGLSTALAVLGPEAGADLTSAFPGVRVRWLG